MLKLAIATYKQLPQLIEDDRLLLPELERRGFSVETATWNDTNIDWQAYDAVLIRSTWDYFQHIEEFRAWLSKLEADGVRVWNPVSVLKANIDKTYLLELEARGVPLVPTAWIKRGESTSLKSAVEKFNSAAPDTEFVLKPTISAGAYLTHRFKYSEIEQHDKSLAEILRHSDAMIQPFLAEVLTEGEWSFLFFGGEFSHAILKAPKSGDYRVQFIFGGTTTPQTVPASWIEEARAVVQKTPGPLLYARVDMIRHNGKLLLGELELTEPCLYLSYDPEAAGRLADAIKLRVHPKRSKS